MRLNLNFLLLVAILINFFIPSFILPLFNYDEGAFCEATREMLFNHNYITTYLNGNLRFDKPILIYWLQLISIKIFGINEFAFRLPSAVASTLWATSIYIFSKKYFNEKVAFFSSIIFIGTFQLQLINKAAIADALLNLFIANSMFFTWSYLESKKNKFLYLAFLFIALGFLTKGPVAVLIPLATTFLYQLIKKDLKTFFKMVFNPTGILIFLVVAMPWYILEYLDQGEKFIQGFFLKHNIKRFGGTLEHHAGTLFYFIPVILMGFTPYTKFLFEVFIKIKNYFKNDISLFLLIWFLFVFIFFSFSGTKLPHYVIYGYTPLFILIGTNLAKSKNPINFSFLSFNILIFILFFSFKYILEFITPKNLFFEELFSAGKILFGIKFQLITILILLLFIVLKYIKIRPEYKIAFITISFGAFINLIVLKNYAIVVQEPIKKAALYCKKNNCNAILYHFARPTYMVYRDNLSLKKTFQKGDFILTSKNNLKDFKKYSVKFFKNGVYLIRIE